jgi:membrane-associated phospholipid phosphatase
VLNVTRIIEMRIKYALACKRPADYSPQIQPMIANPGHGSLPSGHATEAFVVAFMLDAMRRHAGIDGSISNLATGDPTFVQLMRHAERIATNRTVAGVHFPADSIAGMVLAFALSSYFTRKLSGLGDVSCINFLGEGIARTDFRYHVVLADLLTSTPSGTAPGRVFKSDPIADIDSSPLLEHLWKSAIDEWR